MTLLHSKALLLDSFELMNQAIWADDKEAEDKLEACVSHLERAGEFLTGLTTQADAQLHEGYEAKEVLFEERELA